MNDTLPYVVSSGILCLGKQDVGCHLLTDGQQILVINDAVQLLGGRTCASANVRRCLETIPAYRPGMLDQRLRRFRTPGVPVVGIGLELAGLAEMVGTMADLATGVPFGAGAESC